MRYLKYIFLFILMECAGCKKFTEVAPPKTSVITAEAFKTDDAATSAVLGIYADMLAYSDCLTNGAFTVFAGASADELVPNNIGGLGAQGVQFYNNLIPVKNQDISGIWNNAYSTIAQANVCIGGINASVLLTPSLKKQLLAEARFSRALIYFYLLNTFGDVPLVLDLNWAASRQLARTPVSKVYDQVILDLQFAADNLTTTYLTGEKVRPNKYAAEALLARVYIYNQNWAKAEEQASLVIESGVYGPLDDLDNVFLKNSDEAIFQLRSFDNQDKNTDEGALFVPYPGSSPAYRMNEVLLKDFEPGDLRKSHWISAAAVNGDSVYFPFKYKLGNYSGSQVQEYDMVLRLAEVYLVRAEARAENGDLAGAVSDLNVIRDRSRDTPTTDIPDPLPALTTASLNKTGILAAVMHERRIELFAEWGHRWFDLKRTGQADAVLSPLKPQWKSTAQLYPIPNSEILLAPNLKQNPGY